MTINMDIVMNTPEYSVDMKSGLETLNGASETTRVFSETILTGNVPKRKSHKSKVRTNLKRSFKGSYGQVFSLDIYDEDLEKEMRKIPRKVFFELFSYFLDEALYREPKELSSKAVKVIERLGEEAGELIEYLRDSPLKSIHDISDKFDHDIFLRFRKARDEQVVVAKFDSESSESLKAEESDEEFDLVVAVTRLNIHTGNGRFLIEGQDETVAFGFGIGYRDVRLEAKKLFSKNLDHNNGLENEVYRYLRVKASSKKLRSGKVVKYIVKGFYDE